MRQVGVGSGKESRYYNAMNRGSDFLLRCVDCKRLVTRAEIAKDGCCVGTVERACGNRRFKEITTLNEAEMAALVAGTIDFPYRAEFLAEFTAGE